MPVLTSEASAGQQIENAGTYYEHYLVKYEFYCLVVEDSVDKEHNSGDAILDDVELCDAGLGNAGLKDIGSVDAGLDDGHGSNVPSK